MTIKRYDIQSTGYECFEMVEHGYGEYVTFEDYDILCGEYDTLKDKYDRLMEKIGDIWREG